MMNKDILRGWGSYYSLKANRQRDLHFLVFYFTRKFTHFLKSTPFFSYWRFNLRHQFSRDKSEIILRSNWI